MAEKKKRWRLPPRHEKAVARQLGPMLHVLEVFTGIRPTVLELATCGLEALLDRVQADMAEQSPRRRREQR